MYHGSLQRFDTVAILWSVRAFYILAAYAIITVRFIPDLRDRFLDYGARSVAKDVKPKARESVLPRSLQAQLDSVLDRLAQVTVPHSWFSHFYFCSTVSSALWLYLRFRTSDDLPLRWHAEDFTSWEHRAMLGLLLMQIQGLRRLYECLVIAKPSKSRMWFGHYAIGIAFYLATNLAIGLEPVLDLRAEPSPRRQSLAETIFNAARIAACLYTFLLNSFRQFQVHKYLASLTTYQVPNHHIFVDTNLICPHYECEVKIYLALSVLTARDRRVFNPTMLCAVLFVIVNLGVTADGTKNWLMRKFPKQRIEIAQRRKMLRSIW